MCQVPQASERQRSRWGGDESLTRRSSLSHPPQAGEGPCRGGSQGAGLLGSCSALALTSLIFVTGKAGPGRAGGGGHTPRPLYEDLDLDHRGAPWTPGGLEKVGRQPQVGGALSRLLPQAFDSQIHALSPRHASLTLEGRY